MKVPLSWLKEFVDIDLPAPELAMKLTFAGLEVEEAEYIGLASPTGTSLRIRAGLVWDRDKILIGRLAEVKPHPNADRLTLAVVDYGQKDPIQVVTGAPNIKPGDRGQKVVVALRGATLYDGHKEGQVPMVLKEAVLRGIKNDSMVCSEKELGLSQEHEGILILPDEAPVGMPLVDFLGDVVFDIKINPNMARAQSILGLAREVAALTGSKFHPPSSFLEPLDKSISETDWAEIEIADGKLCPRFTAMIIRNVSIQRSPFWIQRRLQLIGMRPINNIVDITNYVMWESKPLHAFDYDKLLARANGRRPRITIRAAQAGERMQTLDGVEREFGATDVLVADTKGPVGIGGIMGGADTEVSESTRNVLLESATFDSISIRRTTLAQKLPSEAATRFGRGIPPITTYGAALRAAELMSSLGSGQVDRAVADNFASPYFPTAIPVSSKEVERQVGVAIHPERIVSILRSLDFDVSDPKGDSWRVTPPAYRTDVDGVDDVVEEVARVYGYENIPAVMVADALPTLRGNTDLEREERVRDLLSDEGLQEVVTYSLTNPEREARIALLPEAEGLSSDDGGTGWGHRPYVMLENPISQDRNAMRQMLLPGILDVVALNWRQKERVSLYEIGRVYLELRKEEEGSTIMLPEDQGLQLPLESRRLAFALWGTSDLTNWKSDHAGTIMDFYDLKGVIEALLEGLHLKDRATFAPSAYPSFHPGRAATLSLDGRAVGSFGELHPALRPRFDLPDEAILVGEFDLDAILSLAPDRYAVTPLSMYPVVKQDLALVMDERIPAQRASDLIRQTGGSMLTRLELFDVYRGDQIAAGKKSLAYSLTFQSLDKVLTDSEVARIRERIVQRANRELGAELRGG